mgnify:CR=1 FL=1
MSALNNLYRLDEQKYNRPDFNTSSNYFEKKVKEMREKYFCSTKDAKIPERFDNTNELAIIKKLWKDSEKENKKLLSKENSSEEIKLTHFNNKYNYILTLVKK